jgi:UDP-glucose 4-epimerase
MVTGAAGFIGSHLVDRLVGEGRTVIAIDDLSAGRLSNLSSARSSTAGRLSFHRSDITSNVVAELVRKHRPEVVFHLAASIDVRASIANPVHDAMINLIGTINLLDACSHSGVRKFIFASSGGAIYGEPNLDSLPVSEEVAFSRDARPESPYGVSKKAVFDYLRYFRASSGLDFTALALANVYGPRQEPSAQAGLEGAVIAVFTRRMLARRPCTIFGDGSQTRDFVYVSDVVAAFASAIEVGGGELVNVGSGQEVSINELHERLADVTGVAVEPNRQPARPGEVLRNCLDRSKAAAILEWRPQVELPKGLQETVAWTRQNPV